ncbi:BZ3500_MvSof-1268-A1-R1_Chr2-3g05321 [Microbotryum saponariae]|uniref:BZ3500_MvSof-1268-A1-R1_Chr2-3g05321 protein n=1 Tax=Microbotryum saponariae TaxID=289078 RepID=A0A2X0LPY6_9BASI|nr:BZ3500_MvSof-1268-A1-R1_Chr2-3g05321 [Microbotryum saponariae]SDA01193.1 BZ3501_MvSof-1269-A2-R1_Chr2-2g04994 [Microbotryum saponariae]
MTERFHEPRSTSTDTDTDAVVSSPDITTRELARPPSVPPPTPPPTLTPDEATPSTTTETDASGDSNMKGPISPQVAASVHGTDGSSPPRLDDSRPAVAPLAVLAEAASVQSAWQEGLLNVPSPLANVEESFELKIIQQPGVGAEAGFGKMTLGRLPVVPAPVVQVLAKDTRGRPIDREFPYLFCSCALKAKDGTSPIDSAQASTPFDTAPPPIPSTSSAVFSPQIEPEFSALVGNLVSNSQRATNLDGDLGNYFVFEDLAVRGKGTYKLEFRLGKIQRPSSPKLASVVSDAFDVVDWRDYPGRPADRVLTNLSRHLANQGIPMYIPPLHQLPALPE